MPQTQCKSCGITVQPADLVCLKCGSPLDGTPQPPRLKCEKCGGAADVKYYQFIYASKQSQEQEARPGEPLPRSDYKIGGQDGAWICPRHRWSMPGRSDRFFQFIFPVICLVVIPSLMKFIGSSQEILLLATVIAILVALFFLVYPLVGWREINLQMHAIALKKKQYMDQGWDTFFTPVGYLAWSKTGAGGGSAPVSGTVIELAGYETFLDKLCLQANQPISLVQGRLRAHCASCGARFTDEALSHLYLMGPTSSYRRRMGDAVVLAGATPGGEMLRAGQCPACGGTQMKISLKA